jgi:hypothetical protein
MIRLARWIGHIGAAVSDYLDRVDRAGRDAYRRRYYR